MELATLGHYLKPALMVLLLPPVPLMLLIALGAVLLCRRPRAGAFTVTLGLLGLWLSTCEGTSQWLTRHLLDAPQGLDARTLGALRDEGRRQGNVAVLVLGAGTRDYVPEYLGAGLQPLTLERLRYGVWLARRLESPLGFTGGIGWGAKHKLFPEAVVVERVAREEFGLPLRWAESRSRDTRQNASLSLPMLKAAGIRKVVLVTSVQHMPRALQNFRDAAQADMEIVAAPAGLVFDGMTSMQDWCPTDAGFRGVRYAVYEWLGSLAGH